MYSVPNDKKTTWYYRVIRWLVWVFSPKYRLEGTENLPQEPCVIVGNHSHMYGPIAGELYIPGKRRIWCAGEMMCVFNNAHTVAVYHDTRLISTFRDAMAKLQEGNSMVIFPEHYDEHNNIVHDFQDKFVDLARFYYKKTGTELSFVPLYVCPALKTLTFGKPIRFRASAPIAEERRRICGGLMDAITEIATLLPEHTGSLCGG